METPAERQEKDALYDFICSLDNLQVKGNTINSIQYEGIPLWWFCKVRFMRDLLPREFDNFNDFLKLQKKTKLRAKMHLYKKRVHSRILAEGLQINDQLKRRVAGKRHPEKEEETKTDKKNVLFLAHTIAIEHEGDEITRIDRVNPVYHLEQKDPKLQAGVVVMDALSAKASSKLAQYPHLIHREMTKEIALRSEKKGKILENSWKEFKKGLRATLTGKQSEYLQFFEPALDFFFSRQTIGVTLLYYETFKKIFTEKKVDAVVVYASGMTLERAAIQAAQKLSIPSIRLMHGLTLPYTTWTYPQTFFVLSNNELEKKRNIQLGAPAESSVVTGPVFLQDIEVYWKKEKTPNKIPVVLFCTAPMIDENVIEKEKYFQHMKTFLAELKEVNGGNCIVKLKLHPLEKEIQEYQKVIEDLEATNITVVEGMGKNVLYELIHECDAFVSFFSTTVSEANLLNRPTVMIDLYDRHFVDRSGMYFKNSKAVIKVDPNDTGQLQSTVQKVLFDKKLQKDLDTKRKEFVRLFFYKKDADGPKRAVENIKKIMKKFEKTH